MALDCVWALLLNADTDTSQWYNTETVESMVNGVQALSVTRFQLGFGRMIRCVEIGCSVSRTVNL